MVARKSKPSVELNGDKRLPKESATSNLEALPPDIIRSEVNFLVLPFFALSRRDAHQRLKTEYSTVVKRGEEKLEISWRVLAHQEYGYPRPFDGKVHKAIEQIISGLSTPAQNPIPLGSLYNLAKILGLRDSGRVYCDIKASLQRVVTTAIESKGTFYQKDKKKWLERTFHLYDDVVFVGESLPSGEEADTNYLFLSNWYLDSINARYVRPLDYSYYRSLKGNVAARIYELLGVKFYGLGNYPHIRYRYSTLCQILPLTQQRYSSQAKQKLNPAHQELMQTGFLEGAEWSNIPGENRDWYVTYWPGPRAKEEIQHFRQALLPAETSSISADEPGIINDQFARPRKRIAKKEEGLTEAQQELASRLKGVGVSQVTAVKLVLLAKPGIIGNWLKVIEYEEGIQDRPAYLVKALREGWQLPESFQQRKAQPQEEERQVQELHCQQNCSICHRQGFYRIDGKTMAWCDHSEKKKPAPKGQQPTIEPIWEEVLTKLQSLTSQPVYESWLKDTKLIGTDGESVYVGVASEWARDWLERRLYGLIARTLEEALGQEVVVEFIPAQAKATPVEPN